MSTIDVFAGGLGVVANATVDRAYVCVADGDEMQEDDVDEAGLFDDADIPAGDLELSDDSGDEASAEREPVHYRIHFDISCTDGPFYARTVGS